MDILSTPFGDIDIQLDGTSIPYTAVKGSIGEDACPDVHDRFLISVRFVPDGRKHVLSCVFIPCCSYERTSESGEFLELQSFYNADRIKMSIGLRIEDDAYILRAKDALDAEYLENGMAFLIPDKETAEKYEFGIAWIDDVGWDDPVNDENEARDVQTWFAADPFYL